MLSLNVFRCAGDIDKTNVNTMKKCVWDMGKRNVFEAVVSACAGDRLLTMNLAQQQSVVCRCSMVCIGTDLGNNGCDVLRPRFLF